MQQCVHLRPDFPAWRRSSSEELVNAVTHGIGFVIATVGSLVMMPSVLAMGQTNLTIGCSVYLLSLVTVYAMSTLSHSATSVRWKSLFRQLDQAFIYVLIVATYTPFALAFLPGHRWDVLLAAMWLVALIGFFAKLLFAHRVETASVVSYIFLGWMPIVAIPTLYHTAPQGVFQAIMAGGAFYTVGTFFLVYDERVKHFHAAWHLCVISGSACHFLGILAYVVHRGM
jgi:hemolysin III